MYRYNGPAVSICINTSIQEYNSNNNERTISIHNKTPSVQQKNKEFYVLYQSRWERCFLCPTPSRSFTFVVASGFFFLHYFIPSHRICIRSDLPQKTKRILHPINCTYKVNRNSINKDNWIHYL